MTELEREALQDAHAACLASAEAIAAVLARVEVQATPAIPVSEYIKAGDAAILLRVSKRTVLR